MRATGERDERVEITWMRVLVAYVYKSPPLFRPPQSYIIWFCTHHTAFLIICERGLRPRFPSHLTRGAVAEMVRRRGRGAAQKRKRQSVNRMRHRRRARPRRSARATDHSTATIDLTGVGANASYPCGRFAAIDPRTGARQSRAEAAESSRRFDQQARHRAGLCYGF